MIGKATARNGFTLIELMIVIAIVAVLAAIAYPSYREQVSRSRRADAKTVLMENAQFMERFYTQNGTYSGATLPILEAPKDGNTKYYDLAFTSGQPTATTFIVEATPKGAMAGDACGAFTINQAGLKQTSGGTRSLEECWSR
jgi:type IV pilus assembly protein PilE